MKQSFSCSCASDMQRAQLEPLPRATDNLFRRVLIFGSFQEQEKTSQAAVLYLDVLLGHLFP